MRFLGGVWSFPGGVVDAADRDRQVPGAQGPEQAAAMAACARELEEETGVCIAPDARALAPAGRWLAPALSPIRYDARYYAVACPAGQEPDVSNSGGELVAGAWLTPGEALSSWRRGERLVSPPALELLELLDRGWERLSERADAAQRVQAEGPPVWRLAPGIAALPLRTPTLPPATHTNCYLLGDEDIVVVDPGSPYPDEQELLWRALDERKAAGSRLRAIALTHHHPDHVGGVSALAERYGLPVWAHANTAAAVGGADRELTDGERVELAGDPPRRFEVMHTPGHAPGHLCFVCDSTRYAVAGDMIASVGTIVVDPYEGDMSAYVRSLERLKSERLRVLLPAHGGPIADPDEKLGEYVAHRAWREAKIQASLDDAGQELSALVRVVYDDVPPAVYPLAERSLLSHLLKLEREGRARRAGSAWSRAA